MIFRTRRRPRVHSASWRTLYWLIRLEATFYARHGYAAGRAPREERFAWVMLDPRARLRGAALGRRLYPSRKVQP